jgi:hypothetical protein
MPHPEEPMKEEENGVRCSCGSELFFESVQVRGWWTRLVTGDGEIEDTNIDNLQHTGTPKTVRCAECGNRNPNPLLKAQASKQSEEM